jgi:hypothetical protein
MDLKLVKSSFKEYNFFSSILDRSLGYRLFPFAETRFLRCCYLECVSQFTKNPEIPCLFIYSGYRAKNDDFFLAC